jgi:hypothetical protein
VMWLIVAQAVPMVLLARTLPVTRAERRAQSAVAGAAELRVRQPQGQAMTPSNVP